MAFPPSNRRRGRIADGISLSKRIDARVDLRPAGRESARSSDVRMCSAPDTLPFPNRYDNSWLTDQQRRGARGMPWASLETGLGFEVFLRAIRGGREIPTIYREENSGKSPRPRREKINRGRQIGNKQCGYGTNPNRMVSGENPIGNMKAGDISGAPTAETIRGYQITLSSLRV